MLFRDVIDLVSVTPVVDDIGNFVDTESTKTVYANKKNIRQSEFYQAMSTGLRPELMFVVRSGDYNNEPRLTYNSKTYKIIRAYDKNGELTELVCGGLVGAESR